MMSNNTLLSLMIIFIFIVYGCCTQSSLTCSGDPCQFPFIYNGVAFNECTNYGRANKWCATTYNYTNDQLWGYCDCDNNNNNISHNLSGSYTHYAYSKGMLNNGVIETLVINLFFNDRINDEKFINYTYEKYQNVFDSVSTYFSDSSYNKLTYNFTLIGNDKNYITNLSSTATTEQIALEAYRLAELDGYIYCNGICGRNDLFHHNLYRENGKHFDQLVVIINPQGHISWSGSATTGHTLSWILSTSFDTITFQHEFGHNLGLNHQFTNKYARLPTNFDQEIGEFFDGETVMGGGGSIDINNKPFSRFKENGHFGPCSKDWFGWFDDGNIIDISVNDINDIDFDDIMYYRLYAFDRPDVKLNNIADKIFLIRLSWPSQYEFYSETHLNRVYIFYRTSYDGGESGISIEYCLLNKLPSIESGANIQPFTYDINGDTFIQSDHYLSVNESFVIEPFLLSEEDGIIFDRFVNPYLAELNKINVSVISKGNEWDNCNGNTFICDGNNDLYMDIAINFVSSSEENEIIDHAIQCNGDTRNEVINMKYDEKYKIIHITSNEIGSYGRGESTFSIYPKNTHIKAYIFDKYPNNIPKSIGSMMSFTFMGNMDDNVIDNQKKNGIYPIKAIQIIQKEESVLHIAEIEMYAEINGKLTNIAINNSNIHCHSFPSIGHIGDILIDGDISTHSRSKQPIIGSYDVCIFNEPIYNIKQIKVYPHDAFWDRSSNLTLNIFGNAFIGSTYNQNAFEFTDLLFTYEIKHPDTGYYGEWEGKHEIITIPQLTQILQYNSSMNNVVTVPFIHGHFYVLLERLDFDTDNNDIINEDYEISIDFELNECVINQCPINTYLNGINICERCPNNHYTELGADSISDCKKCPFHRELKHTDSEWCSIQECMQLIVTHNNGLYNKIDGIYHNIGRHTNGNTVYISSSLNYAILYDINKSSYKIIDIQNNNKQIANSSVTFEPYPFLLDSNEWYEENVIHFDNIPNTKIKAIQIIQNANNSANPTFNSLTIAEIKVYSKSDPSTNIAPIYSTCYSFPITKKSVFSGYGGNENGTIYQLTDNDLSTTSNNGNLKDYKYCSESPCYDICIFSEYIEVDHVIIYPPQSNMRFYRTKDLTVKMYTDYDLTNNDIDNEPFIVYNKRMPIKVNTSINIEKTINDKDKPLQMQCPYKYALSCDVLLNELCSGYGSNWFARNILTNIRSNDNLEWVCVNSDILTDDLLNYNLVHNTQHDMIKSINKNNVNSILTQCDNDYIIDSIVTECYVNDIIIDNLEQHTFSVNDKIECWLKMYNLNGDIVYFDSSLSFIEFKLISDDSYFYPIKGVNYINNTDNTIWTKITIPKCDSLWKLSLIFDQHIIGGNRFEIYKDISINVIHNDEFDDELCIQFNCHQLSMLIDNNIFEQHFFESIDIMQDELFLQCIDNKTNVTIVSSTTINNITNNITNILTTLNTNYDETIDGKEINNNNNNNNNTENYEWIIGLIVGPIMVALIVVVVIYILKRKKHLRVLHRNISRSVVAGSPSAIINDTNTVQYVSEESEGLR